MLNVYWRVTCFQETAGLWYQPRDAVSRTRSTRFGNSWQVITVATASAFGPAECRTFVQSRCHWQFIYESKWLPGGHSSVCSWIQGQVFVVSTYSNLVSWHYRSRRFRDTRALSPTNEACYFMGDEIYKPWVLMSIIMCSRCSTWNSNFHCFIAKPQSRCDWQRVLRQRIAKIPGLFFLYWAVFVLVRASLQVNCSFVFWKGMKLCSCSGQFSLFSIAL